MFLLIKVVLIALAALVGLAFVFGRLYKMERRPDAITYTTTADGWTLALCRYFPTETKGRKKRLPVILCHGLVSNHHNWDMNDRLSVSRALANAGYEVFAVDLRGGGYSDRPAWFSPRSYNWNFDDYVKLDAPATIDHVLEVTGAKKCHWIGHSMGGMMAYAFLQSELAKKIQSTVILSSPSRFSQYRPALKLRGALGWLKVIHLETFSKFVAPIAELSPTMQRYFGNLNLPAGMTAAQHANAVENCPTSLLKQFADFAESGKIMLTDGTDISGGLPNITTPMLFMVGSSDFTALPRSVHEVYETVSSTQKEFHYFGPDYGQKDEYGHQTVLMGINADKEVYPLIIDWLDRN